MKQFVRAATLFVMFYISFLNARAEVSVTNTKAAMSPSAEKFLSRICLYSWNDDGKARSIQCFDVSAQGDIAIGFSGASNHTKYIGVYDKVGDFLYGYSFQCSGNYLVKWMGEKQLAIYWLRSSIRATFDQDCVCQEYSPYIDDTSINKQLNNLRKTNRTINGERFYIDKGDGILSQFALGYSRLIHVSSDGIENIVYSATDSTHFSGLFVIAVICFISFAVLYSYKKRM